MFDEVSLVIFRYGDPGDDSLDFQMNHVLAIYGASMSEQVNMGAAVQVFMVKYVHIWAYY